MTIEELQLEIKEQERILRAVSKSRDDEENSEYRSDMNNRVDRCVSLLNKLKKQSLERTEESIKV